MLRAKRETHEVIDAENLDNSRPRQVLANVVSPQKMRSGIVLDGSAKEKAIKLLKILNEKSIISLS
jgi:hypothetical protein